MKIATIGRAGMRPVPMLAAFVLAALAGAPAVAQYGGRPVATDVPKVQFFTPAPNEPAAPVVAPPQAIVPQADAPRAAPVSEPTSPLTAPSAPAPGPVSSTVSATDAPAPPRPQIPRPASSSPAAPPTAVPPAAAPPASTPPASTPSGSSSYFIPGQRTAPAAIATATNPAPVADAFYRTYLQLGTPGVPNAAQRARLRPFLAPALDAALAAAEQAEKTHKAKTAGAAPPLVEGYLFASLHEGATAFIVQECTDQPPGTPPSGMQCHLQLTHTNPTTNQKIEWRDTLLLIRLGNGWRISDVIYGGKFAFGQTGQLTDLLRIIIKEAKEAKE